MKKVLVLLAFVVTAGCMTEKKWAQGCAERFPVKEKKVYLPGKPIIDTAFLPSDTVTLADTITIDCDTVKGKITKHVSKKQPCPPARLITQLRVDTVEITKADSAAIWLAQKHADDERHRADDEQRRADQVTGGRDTWRGIAIVALLLLGVGIISKIKGLI